MSIHLLSRHARHALRSRRRGAASAGAPAPGGPDASELTADEMRHVTARAGHALFLESIGLGSSLAAWNPDGEYRPDGAALPGVPDTQPPWLPAPAPDAAPGDPDLRWLHDTFQDTPPPMARPYAPDSSGAPALISAAEEQAMMPLFWGLVRDQLSGPGHLPFTRCPCGYAGCGFLPQQRAADTLAHYLGEMFPGSVRPEAAPAGGEDPFKASLLRAHAEFAAVLAEAETAFAAIRAGLGLDEVPAGEHELYGIEQVAA